MTSVFFLAADSGRPTSFVSACHLRRDVSCPGRCDITERDAARGGRARHENLVHGQVQHSSPLRPGS
jgi:hypothetical protein